MGRSSNSFQLQSGVQGQVEIRADTFRYVGLFPGGVRKSEVQNSNCHSLPSESVSNLRLAVLGDPAFLVSSS